MVLWFGKLICNHSFQARNDWKPLFSIYFIWGKISCKKLSAVFCKRIPLSVFLLRTYLHFYSSRLFRFQASTHPKTLTNKCIKNSKHQSSQWAKNGKFVQKFDFLLLMIPPNYKNKSFLLALKSTWFLTLIEF